jgi:hypothetical protein
MKLACFVRFKTLTPFFGTTPLKRLRSFKRIAFVAAWSIILASCATQKRCMERWPPVPVDTVTVENTVYRDTTFYVTTPADTIRDSIQVVIPCGETQQTFASDTMRTENKFARAAVWIVGTKLRMRLEIKSQQLSLFVDSVAVANTKTVTITKTVTLEKRVVPPFYKATLFVSIALLLLFALGIFLSSRR